MNGWAPTSFWERAALVWCGLCGCLIVVALLPSPGAVWPGDAPPRPSADATSTQTPFHPIPEAIDAIRARPLFNIGRKVDAPVAVPVAQDAVPPSTSPLTGVVLAGLVLRPGASLAILRDTGGKVSSVKVGDSFQGWRVQKIDDGGIVLSSGVERTKITIPVAKNAAH